AELGGAADVGARRVGVSRDPDALRVEAGELERAVGVAFAGEQIQNLDTFGKAFWREALVLERGGQRGARLRVASGRGAAEPAEGFVESRLVLGERLGQ